MNRAAIRSVAFWSDLWPDWASAAQALRGEPVPPPAPGGARRPAFDLLPPAERRRAPDTVALALAVAQQAVQATGLEAAALPCVFTSSHGDLGITHYLCETLAHDPSLLSPTRFHNAVHNAAVGYWTMAVGCPRASTALSAHDRSFAAGLMEALVHVALEHEPVLLVAYDMDAPDVLSEAVRSTHRLAVALVLAPPDAPLDAPPAGAADAVLAWRLEAASPPPRPVPLRSEAARALAGNGMADALGFLETLAGAGASEGILPLSPGRALRLHLSPSP